MHPRNNVSLYTNAIICIPQAQLSKETNLTKCDLMADFLDKKAIHAPLAGNLSIPYTKKYGD